MHRERKSTYFWCREGLPWKGTQSWWLGREEEISKRGNNMCEEPRVESMVQPQKRTTTLQKAGKKQGLGLWPHSTLPLAQGLAQVFGNCQQQFSELTPLFSSPFCVQLPSTDHVITELFAYRSIICYSTSPHLNQKIDLTYFIFLVPNKMYGFNSERR